MGLIEVQWGGVDWMHTSEHAPVAVSCEHDNNESDSSESRQFIECFGDYEHFKGGSTLWGSLYLNPEQLTMSI